MVGFLKKSYMLARRGMQLLFDKGYDKYLGSDMTINDRTYEYSYVLSRLCGKTKGKVLDLGVVSGFCIPALTLCDMDFEVVGVDLRPFPFRHANYKHVVQDALKEKLPFKDGYFDYAYSISAIEHFGFPNSYGKQVVHEDGDIHAVKEMGRVLKKGGIVLLTVPFGGKQLKVVPGVRFYDRHRIERMMKESGVELSELKIIELRRNTDGNLFEEIPLRVAEQRQQESSSVLMIALIKGIKK